MASDRHTDHYRKWYQNLISLYPGSYRDKFEESMLQTFDDLCDEKVHDRRKPSIRFIAWIYFDTTLSIAKENMISINKVMKNKRIALIGLILIMPFCLLLTTGVIWQILHYFGFAGLPDLASVIPNRAVGYAVIFIFPAIALLINAVALMVSAVQEGHPSVLSIRFVKTNFATLAVLILAGAATLFLFGHDSIPCFVHEVVSGGLHNLWPLIKGCANA